MSDPYPNRYSAVCDCGWFSCFYDLSTARGSAHRHSLLLPGHDPLVADAAGVVL